MKSSRASPDSVIAFQTQGIRFPPLNALRAFEVAARCGSFTRAATELNVTQAAVSHQVKLLEEFLGMRLFERTAVGLRLTCRGKKYFLSIGAAMRIVSQATAEMYGFSAPQVLNISAQPNFATHWLIPRLPRFKDKHPGIVVNISLFGERLDFGDQSVDVAIRYGKGWPDLIGRLLFPAKLVPVCSPQLDHPLIRKCDDLTHHVLIRSKYAPDDWRLWLDHAGLTNVDHTRGPIFDSTLLAIEAARGGLGVALGRIPLLEEDLRDGSLIMPLIESIQPPEGWYLLYPRPARVIPKVIAFQSWILTEAMSTTIKTSHT